MEKKKKKKEINRCFSPKNARFWERKERKKEKKKMSKTVKWGRGKRRNTPHTSTKPPTPLCCPPGRRGEERKRGKGKKKPAPRGHKVKKGEKKKRPPGLTTIKTAKKTQTKKGKKRKRASALTKRRKRGRRNKGLFQLRVREREKGGGEGKEGEITSPKKCLWGEGDHLLKRTQWREG